MPKRKKLMQRRRLMPPLPRQRLTLQLLQQRHRLMLEPPLPPPPLLQSPQRAQLPQSLQMALLPKSLQMALLLLETLLNQMPLLLLMLVQMDRTSDDLSQCEELLHFSAIVRCKKIIKKNLFYYYRPSLLVFH